MDRPHAAPPVVAVVVSRHPGPCFADALAALASQDYPNLSVLVIGSGGHDPSRRVAQVASSAYVRLSPATTYGAAANDVLQSVQGASFLLFAHDDVAPEPRAIRRMVDEAMRSNAGIVAPKVLEWDRPEHILEVGLAVDKSGAAESRAEAGELDQAQHDAVRDVFAVSSTCMLVRADLFTNLGGFDPGMEDAGAGVDLCWRAQVAGARVMVVPASRVRQAGRDQLDPDQGYVERRNHLRTMLKCYSAFHLVRVLPQAALLALAEVIVALFTSKRDEASQVVRAWTWNLKNLGDTRSRRGRVQGSRTVGDSELRRLQVRGSVRAATYIQRRLRSRELAGVDELVDPAGAPHRRQPAPGPVQLTAGLLALLAVAWVVGSRGLVFGSIPAVGELGPFPGASELLGSYLDGWRATGLGANAPAPPALAALATSGLLMLGKMAVLQKLLVLSAWPIGALGLWVATRGLGSPFARMAGLVAYLAIPLPYDSLARGRWSGLVAYAAAPFLLGALMRLTSLAPLASTRATDRRVPAMVLGLGLVTAVAAMVAPSVAVAMLVAGSGLVLGALLAGGASGSLRALAGAAGAVVVAAVLLLPWSLELLGPGGLATVMGVGPDPVHSASAFELARFEIGPVGAAPLGWAFLLAAGLALAIGKGWRLAWAVRLWGVALTCIGVYWAGARGWSPLRFETPDVLLAFAAAAVAVAICLGGTAFEVDLPRYRFGWRQVASVLGGAALVVGTLPILAGARDGRWKLPADELVDSLAWMDEQAQQSRTLWVGDPEALPLDGWHLQDGVAFATSQGGRPSVASLLPGKMSPATVRLRTAIEAARDRETARLGELLAPMGIRYLVLPERLSVPEVAGEDDPSRLAEASPPQPYPLPAAITDALRTQIDLRLVPQGQGLTVYENTAWAPTPSAFPPEVESLPGVLGPGVNLDTTTPVMSPAGRLSYEGDVPGGSQVLLAQGPSESWSMLIGGVSVERYPAYGVANAYRIPAGGGSAELSYETSIAHYGAVAVQVVLWIVAVGALGRLRRERR